jgi:Putative beta-barrel porin 2
MRDKIKYLLLMLGLVGFTNFAVEAKQVLNSDDSPYREASTLSRIDELENQAIYNSQDLGTPLELGIIKSQEAQSSILEDRIYEDKNELGNQIELGAGKEKKEPSVYLSGSVGFTNNKNILYSPINPIEDGNFSTSIGVIAIPKIGKDLRLLLGINQGSIRYSKFRALNLDFKSISAGLIWEANPLTTVSLIGFGTTLYSFPANKELFSDVGFIANIRHDVPLNQNMLFTVAAQSESHSTTSNSVPVNVFSHYSHSLSTTLKTLLLPNLSASLGYQIKFDDYSYQRRNDINNQMNLRLEYAISPQLQIGYLANYNFNSSSNRFSNYGAFSTGLEVSTLMPLF